MIVDPSDEKHLEEIAAEVAKMPVKQQGQLLLRVAMAALEGTAKMTKQESMLGKWESQDLVVCVGRYGAKEPLATAYLALKQFILGRSTP
jgi:hypothetical protein